MDWFKIGLAVTLASGCSGAAGDCAERSFFRDADGDGYGDVSLTSAGCVAPAGYVASADDCDDANSVGHPGATEMCNGIDDDCDGAVDPLCTGTITRVSVASDGSQADRAGVEMGYGTDRGSFAVAVSADGAYVAFVSGAGNLDPAADAPGFNVFRHTMATGATEWVDSSDPPIADGLPSSKNDPQVSVSADGSRLAFYSSVSLDAGVHGAGVYYRDLPGGSVTPVISLTSAGTAAGAEYRPSLSADGTRLVVSAAQSSLDPTACGNPWSYFVDLSAGTFAPMPGADGDSCATTYSAGQALSDDGTTACVVAIATFTDGSQHLAAYSWDVAGGTTTVVSSPLDGQVPDGNAWECTLDADGSVVAFTSDAGNLTADGRQGYADVCVFDRDAGTLDRVSSGSQDDGHAHDPSISDDGRYIAFVTTGHLVEEDTTDNYDVYVYDRTERTTKRVSVSLAGSDPDGDSDQAMISGDGKWVAFTSEAGDLVAGDTNGFEDVFVTARP